MTWHRSASGAEVRANRSPLSFFRDSQPAAGASALRTLGHPGPARMRLSALHDSSRTSAYQQKYEPRLKQESDTRADPTLTSSFGISITSVPSLLSCHFISCIGIPFHSVSFSRMRARIKATNHSFAAYPPRAANQEPVTTSRTSHQNYPSTTQPHTLTAAGPRQFIL